jgi:hypothetical protein
MAETSAHSDILVHGDVRIAISTNPEGLVEGFLRGSGEAAAS